MWNRRSASKVVSALALIGMIGIAEAQSGTSKLTESRFHRIHLRNGNVVDGALVKFTKRGVLLRVSSGEIEIRNDHIARDRDGNILVRLMKVRSLSENPKVVKKPDPTSRSRRYIPPTFERLSPPASTHQERQVVVLSEHVRLRVEKLVSTLGSEVEDTRAIIEEIRGLGPQAIEYLALNLDKLPASARVVASEMVAEATERKPESQLLADLSSGRPIVRARALHALGKTGNRANARPMRGLLKDPEPLVRIAAIEALERLGDRSSLERIADLLLDVEAGVRSRASSAMAAVGRAYDLNDRIARMLVSRIGRSRGTIRAEITRALARFGSAEAVNALERLVRDRSPLVRAEAAGALTRLHAPQLAPVILRQLEVDSDPRVRLKLALCVQKYRLKEAIDSLIAWLQDHDPRLRKSAAETLQTLTGQKLGEDYESWLDWQEENRNDRR